MLIFVLVTRTVFVVVAGVVVVFAGVWLVGLLEMHFEPLVAPDPVFPPNPTSNDPPGHFPSGVLGTSIPFGAVDVVDSLVMQV